MEPLKLEEATRHRFRPPPEFEHLSPEDGYSYKTASGVQAKRKGSTHDPSMRAKPSYLLLEGLLLWKAEE